MTLLSDYLDNSRMRLREHLKYRGTKKPKKTVRELKREFAHWLHSGNAGVPYRPRENRRETILYVAKYYKETTPALVKEFEKSFQVRNKAVLANELLYQLTRRIAMRRGLSALELQRLLFSVKSQIPSEL